VSFDEDENNEPLPNLTLISFFWLARLPPAPLKMRLASLFIVAQVARWFEENDLFLFYSSSVLFIYEGGEANKDWDESSFNRDSAKLRLIDFAHVRRMNVDSNNNQNSTRKDKGYLAGIYKLLDITENILEDQERNGGLARG